MWQEIAVLCTGILTLAYLGWKVYNFFTSSCRPSSGLCGGCSGCSLHEEIKKNKKAIVGIHPSVKH